MAKANVTLENRGLAGWITLRRPTIDVDALRALRDACETFSDDADVRVIVLTGSGDLFSPGWDLTELAGESAAAEIEALRTAGVLGDPFGCFAESPKPVIAALNGLTLGGGLALALAADIRIAAEGAAFGLPEPLLPFGGAIQRLSRIVGRGRALELVLTTERIDAKEALRIGLVGEVVQRDELDARAQTIAERLAERGPLALQYAKETVMRGLDMPLEQAMRFETDLTVILQTTEDRAEGVRAFLEKRPPKFEGR